MLSSLINESVTDAVHGFTGNARTTPSRGMEVVNGDSAPRDVKVRCFCQLMLVDLQSLQTSCKRCCHLCSLRIRWSCRDIRETGSPFHWQNLACGPVVSIEWKDKFIVSEIWCVQIIHVIRPALLWIMPKFYILVERWVENRSISLYSV